MFSWGYPVLDIKFHLCLAVLRLSSLLLVRGGSKNTSRSMYRKDKPRNVPLHAETSRPSCACTRARPSSADPLNSRSIMLSGCWDHAVRKLEVSRPLCICALVKAKASKYSTSQIISMD